MALDVLDGAAGGRVDDEDAGEEVADEGREALGEVGEPRPDLDVQLRGAGGVEGEVSGEEDEEDDAARPNVGLEAVVAGVVLAEQLGGDVVGGAAAGVAEGLGGLELSLIHI